MIMGLAIELKPGFWSLNKITNTSWPINMNMPVSINKDGIEIRLRGHEAGDERVSSRCTAISFRTRSAAMIPFTAVSMEYEATPIRENQTGRSWRSFRKILNSAIKLNDVAAAQFKLILLLIAEQRDLPNEAKAMVEGRSIINIWRPQITQQW